MRRLGIFHREKFINRTNSWQHKKLSELLKEIYENFLHKKQSEELIDHYLQLCSWIDIEPLDFFDGETISKRYHWHLQKAQVSLKEHNLLPSIRTNDNFAKEEFLNHWIYLDDIRSAHNVGSIIRTTEALRVGHICFSSATPYVDNTKVQKAAMGADKHTPCKIINSDNFINDLPRPFIGFDTSDDAVCLYDFIFPTKNTPFTLFLGNEEYGLSKDVIKELDYLVEIPMVGVKNSLNVACCYAICAAEIRRQSYC